MTEVNTKAQPRNIALEQPTIRLLALNQSFQIDVCEFDNTSSQVEKLGLDRTKQIPLETLAKANLMFYFASEIQKKPGQNPEDDKAIIAHIKANISPNITNPDQVIKELIQAWNTVTALNAGAQANQTTAQEAGEPSSLKIKPHDNYDKNIYTYATKYLSTLTRFDQIGNGLFLQSNELLRSTIEGRPFSTNRFEQLDILIHSLEICIKEHPDNKDAIEAIKTRLKRENRRWVTDVQQMIAFEINSAFDDDELEQDNVIHMLSLILVDKYSARDIEDKEGLFDLTLKALRAPHNQKLKPFLAKQGERLPLENEVRQAIKAAIIRLFREKDIIINLKLLVQPQAGSSAHTADLNNISLAEKLALLLDKPDSVATDSLIDMSKAADEVLRDVAQQLLIQRNEKYKGSVRPEAGQPSVPQIQDVDNEDDDADSESEHQIARQPETTPVTTSEIAPEMRALGQAVLMFAEFERNRRGRERQRQARREAPARSSGCNIS